MQRFFLSGDLSSAREVILPREINHQIGHVLRLKRGERIVLFDGSGYDFIAELQGDLKTASVIEKVLNRREPARKLFLFQSLLKKDKMEWVFQKGTELGVFEFFPIVSSRSVKKDFNMTRALKIIGEAAEQSGRSLLPKTHEIMSFKESLDFVQKERISGVLAHGDSKKRIFEILKEPMMALFIGPEGGWNVEEVNEARECGFQIVNLGRLRLRSETAAIVASALLLS